MRRQDGACGVCLHAAKNPGLLRGFSLVKVRQSDVLMDRIVIVRITLRFLILPVTGFASFWIFRVPSLSKILLSLDRKHELLVTLTAYKNPRLIPNFHRVHPSQ
jgi:hypothetical protein